MAKTITSLIIGALKDSSGQFVSPGELYQSAIARGYNGDQARLLFRAENMADRGIIDGARRGMAQRMWFKYNSVEDGGAH